jgi:hypothetical protein
MIKMKENKELRILRKNMVMGSLYWTTGLDIDINSIFLLTPKIQTGSYFFSNNERNSCLEMVPSPFSSTWLKMFFIYSPVY